jgi:hypothetical protein
MSTGAAPTFGASESSFASVVHVPKMLKPWQKLGDDEMLAQLHKKYWGTPLEPKEVQYGLTSDPSHMNEDDSNESKDADIIPGCFGLHFENQFAWSSMQCQSIWIRVSLSPSADITVTNLNLMKLGRLNTSEFTITSRNCMPSIQILQVWISHEYLSV